MAGGRTRRAVACGFVMAGMLVHAQAARALEAFEGRIQFHGFVEEQLRVLDGSFNEEADLAQWYNVLNLELETDILPNGWGPIDLLQTYTRVEARYDCVYSHGCGTMKSVNTYGNRSKRLPQRLRDAQDQDYGGVIAVADDVQRIADQRPSPFGVLQVIPNVPRGGPDPSQWTQEELIFNDTWIKQNAVAFPGFGSLGTGYNPALPESPTNRPYITIVRLREGFPGFDTLYQTVGADAELGVNPDTGTDDDPANYTFDPVDDYLWAFRSKKGPDGGTGRTLIMGPWLPRNTIRTFGTLSGRASPFRGVLTPTRNGLATISGQTPRSPVQRTINIGANSPTMGPFPYPNYDPAGDTVDQRVVDFFYDPVWGWNGLPGPTPPGSTSRFPRFIAGQDGSQGLVGGFGGDFSGIIPCFQPSTLPTTSAQGQINGTIHDAGCFPNLNVRAIGGVTELPARPAPDKGNLEAFDKMTAQGLYVPSSNLRRALLEQDFDTLGYNISETERAWNRGQSQKEWKEVKEAYVDIETLDSRLWMRFGLQNIVWGKTELFRTSDQFNPQDLALASLASLEESRIALMAGRFVYSLYDVGPLEDVRAEFAFNFDKYKPADLGACGEAFTPDVVCGITTGLFFHGVTGIGIAGVDRPPDPWDDIKGLEIGGRVEWRWDRFSFALMDFWGYGDFPFPDSINYYERNVDPQSGRPRIAGATGMCATPGAFYGSFLGFPFEVGGADPRSFVPMQGGLGMGVDPDCLKAGASASGVNANQWDPDDYAALLLHYANPGNPAFPLPVLYDLPGSSPQNALENHPANQQVFAFICSGTVTIAASVDPGACAWTIFGSGRPLSAAIPVPLSEVFSTLFAGEVSQDAQNFFRVIESNTKGGTGNFEYFTPVRPLNVNVMTDGVITAFHPLINKPDPANPGVDSIFPNRQDWLTMDSTLSNEQRAMLGCGPFYGTRCDSGVGGIYNNGTPQAKNYQFWGFGFGGGMDVLNAEASAILQSFPGFEGTNTIGMNGFHAGIGWTTTNRNLVQPGTIGFEGGPVCTRYVGGRVIVLPGCRGAKSITPDFTAVVWRVTFDDGYDVAKDGCVFGATLSGVAIVGTHEDGTPVNLAPCNSTAVSYTRVGNYDNEAVATTNGAGTLFHPLAGCKTEAQVYSTDSGPAGRQCDFRNRNFEQQFLNQYLPNPDPNLPTAQIFRSELAALSWNMMMFLVTASCDALNRSIAYDPECFNPVDAYNPERCSFAAPHFCGNVKGFLGVGGPNSNRVEAGGNGRFGRRDFIWHSGGELALRYPKRNVFGLSTDFSEDVSKTNWGVEFTWIGATPYLDSNSYENGVTDSDSLNLTVSIDRPTFINFLNANRTFFFNTQWFFQYLTNYNNAFQQNGPFNVLFTFAAFTGYYQDRLLPQMVTVFDFGSHSAGFLPSITYRFNESFSVSTGINYFTGQGQYKQMPVRAWAPTSNRAGKNAYEDGVENVLTAIHRRDEVFVRLRYTF